MSLSSVCPLLLQVFVVISVNNIHFLSILPALSTLRKIHLSFDNVIILVSLPLSPS
jgi:hypothetical protein